MKKAVTNYEKNEYLKMIYDGMLDNKLDMLYISQEIESQKKRIINAINKFSEIYPKRDDIHIYSAPGRTEIGGNHTDHQHGCYVTIFLKNGEVILMLIFLQKQMEHLIIYTQRYSKPNTSVDINPT